MKIKLPRVAAAMAERGMSVKKLGILTGVSSVTISKILGKRSAAKPATVAKMAAALGLSVEETGVEVYMPRSEG